MDYIKELYYKTQVFFDAEDLHEDDKSDSNYYQLITAIWLFIYPELIS